MSSEPLGIDTKRARNHDWIWLMGFGIALVVLVAGTVYLTRKSAAKWAAFVEEHHCQKVAQTGADVVPVTSTSITPDGKFSTTTSLVITEGKDAWQCDDGVTYWR
jgi:photosystem II stability/assembly factor-like uncharacterized protein